ncbi:MAG: type IV secretion system protein, partial [Bacteroidota bacterium]|nr:type IV secretion system protein [Bacteroidota bacterium]
MQVLSLLHAMPLVNKSIIGLVILTIFCGSFAPLIGHAQNAQLVCKDSTGANVPPVNNSCPDNSTVYVPPGSTLVCVSDSQNTPPVNGNCPSGTLPVVSLGASKGTDAPPSTPTGLDNNICTDLGTCIASLVYMVPAFSAFIAYIAAFFFDALAQLSISSSGYALDFLANGWKTILSIANILFLFGFIYIAVTIILNSDTAGTMRSLATLIIMAVLVNFSFFAVRVVIDAGNLLATQFYNAIPAATFNPPSLFTSVTSASGVGINAKVKDLTAPIMDSVRLQSLWSNKNFNTWVGRQNQNGFSGLLNELITLTFLYIAVAAIYWVLIFAFFMNGIKFLLRTVILWLVIMAAPLALVMSAFPAGKNLFKKWQNELIQNSFYPAVFFLIFLVIIMIVQGVTGYDPANNSGGLISSIFSDSNSVNASAPIVDSVANVVIRMGIIIAMLYFGLKASDHIAETGGKFAQNISGKVSGYTAGLARNTARTAGGFTLQKTVGAAGTAADSRLAATTFGNTKFGYALRKGTTKKAAGTKFFGYESHKDSVERASKEARERADKLRDNENKLVANRIGMGSASFDDMLRLSNMSTREKQALGREGIWSILHHLDENKSGIIPGNEFNTAVKGNKKFTDAQKEALLHEWVRRRTERDGVAGG